MKITSITRLISDHTYGNLSAHAELYENEDMEKAAVELDSQIREALRAIENNITEVQEAKRQMKDTKNYLEDVLEKVKEDINGLPF